MDIVKYLGGFIIDLSHSYFSDLIDDYNDHCDSFNVRDHPWFNEFAELWLTDSKEYFSTAIVYYNFDKHTWIAMVNTENPDELILWTLRLSGN